MSDMFAKRLHRRAEISLPLQAIVEIVLISFAAVAMLAFVSKLGDNTAFQQKMLGREAALAATVAASSPSSSFVRIVHNDLPMDLFTFSLEDNRVGVRVRDDTVSYPYGGLGPRQMQRENSAFIVGYDGRLSLSNQPLVLPFRQVCPRVVPSKRNVYIDAGASSTIDEQVARPFVDALLNNVPPGLLGVIDQRSAQGLFGPERSQTITLAAKPTISLFFDPQVTKPMIYYSVNSPSLLETKKLVCALSNEVSTLSTPVVGTPVNLAVLKGSDLRQVVDDADVIVQLVLSPSMLSQSEDQERLKQAIYNAVEVYLS